eukprot:GFUD01121127.1.p1 GENE.GFUD01121127.1~~GFUD01121127.1.p1  ORF type:complete len:639 (-),score=177.01 GFUD01121127.1:95-2011(-)
MDKDLEPEQGINSCSIPCLQAAGPVMVNMEMGITFSWSSLNVSTTPQEGRRCCGMLKSQPKPEKQILKNVSGIARPGEVLAIMGASGAGKSTLLNTLLFRNIQGLQVTGARIANKSLVTPTSLTAVSGYVQQDDLFIPSLTVREHLTFQARVRMDSDIPREQRMTRVQEVINELGLGKAADSLIGGEKMKGISGGEKKRLSFASEFLTNPALLFCDEPTSGLDSFMAQSVMELLSNLAKTGKTIICTIHQPSSQLFSNFDKLLLLAEGQTAYLGDAPKAKDFFSSINHPCPQDFNPADHFVQLLAVVPGKEEECHDRIKTICHQFNESEMGIDLFSAVKTEEAEITEKEQSKAEKVSPYKASFGEQFSALAWRQALAVIKNPMIVKVRIIQAFVIAIILGVIYQGQDNNQAGIQNANGALFVLITNMSFGSIFGVCNAFCSELPVFLREHFNGMYRSDVYFLAKNLVELPLSIVEPMIVITILYWMVGLNPEADRFFIAAGIVLLVVQVVISLGYFMSCIAPNIDIALAIAPVVIIPFMLFGGFYLNSGSVPVWLSWLKYMSWFLYGFEALLINQWSGVKDISCEQSNLSCLTTGEQVLDNKAFEKANFSRDIGMLVLLAVVLRVLAFAALVRKTRRK